MEDILELEDSKPFFPVNGRNAGTRKVALSMEEMLKLEDSKPFFATTQHIDAYRQ